MRTVENSGLSPLESKREGKGTRIRSIEGCFGGGGGGAEHACGSCEDALRLFLVRLSAERPRLRHRRLRHYSDFSYFQRCLRRCWIAGCCDGEVIRGVVGYVMSWAGVY